MEGGQTFWNYLPDDIRNHNKYGILYEGFANETQDNNTQSPDILHYFTTQDITSVLTQKTKDPDCNILMIQTERPKLLLLEITPGTSTLQNKKSLV